MISANMVLNCAAVKYHQFNRTSIRIRRYHVPHLFGPLKMLAMKNAVYRLHLHLKMAPEQRNKTLKVSVFRRKIKINQANWIIYFWNFSSVGNATTSFLSTDSTKTVCIKQTITDINCTYAIACKNDEQDSVSYCTQFDPSGNGQNLWNDLHKNGKLSETVLDAELKGKTQENQNSRKSF